MIISTILKLKNLKKTRNFEYTISDFFGHVRSKKKI